MTRVSECMLSCTRCFEAVIASVGTDLAAPVTNFTTDTVTEPRYAFKAKWPMHDSSSAISMMLGARPLPLERCILSGPH